MNKNLIKSLAFIGLIALLSGCEKDGTKVILSSNPVAPTIVSLPDLTLVRDNGNDTLEFIGTPVDPGFPASATYLLEACESGNDFEDIILLYSGIQDTLIQVTVTDVNSAMIKTLETDVVTSVDFRIRAILVVDAGTGAPGTGDNLFSYPSASVTEDVTTYGLPRLDLIGSGINQKIESALGDGKYVSYVNLNTANPFTLWDPDADITYGGIAGTLAVDGPAIVPETTGWYKLNANTQALTYVLKRFNVGVIGDATPNGWSAPDQKMQFNPKSGLWELTLDLVVGSIKFRINDSWDDGINLGIGTGYSLDNLMNGGSSANIPIAAAGNYTIKLNIGETKYSCTITEN